MPASGYGAAGGREGRGAAGGSGAGAGAGGAAGREDLARARAELERAVVGLGLPAELAGVLARELRGEGSMRRMSAYLREVRPARMEDIADELLAITFERDVWSERKASEESNHRFYEMQRARIHSADVDVELEDELDELEGDDWGDGCDGDEPARGGFGWAGGAGDGADWGDGCGAGDDGGAGGLGY